MFSSFSILLRISIPAALSYTNCYFENLKIASVRGNYNHYNCQLNDNCSPNNLLAPMLQKHALIFAVNSNLAGDAVVLMQHFLQFK